MVGFCFIVSKVFLQDLKDVALEIVETLVVIFQESLDSGMVPEDWKIANVTPLFKKRTRQKRVNLRQLVHY